MTYTRISIPKTSGAATQKRDRVYIYDAQDVLSDVTRTLGDTEPVGNLVLRSGCKGISIQAARTTISRGYEQSGDADARIFADRVEFDYPGDTVALNNFIEAFANKGVVIILDSCDGATKIYGRVCNPLAMQVEPTDSREGRRSHLVFAQEIGDRYVPRIYSGIIPPVANDDGSRRFWLKTATWDEAEEWTSE